MIYPLRPFFVNEPASLQPVLLYEVPVPRGKTPGVNQDGRLNALRARVSAGVLTVDTVELYYVDPSGQTSARWLWTLGAGSTLFELMLTAEPAYTVVGVDPGTGAPALFVAQGRQEGFTWLSAGSQVFILAAGSSGVVVDINALYVEDFGQQAAGDEFDAGPSLELPVALFPAGQED